MTNNYNNYSVYVKPEWNNNLIWVKTFYGSNYKHPAGAYRAALRYAKQKKEKEKYSYIVLKDE